MTARSAPAPVAPAHEAETAGAVASDDGPQSAPLGRALRWLVHALLFLLVAITAVSAVPDLSGVRAALLLLILVALVSVYSIGARRQAARTRGRAIEAEPRALTHLLPTVLLWGAALVLTPEAAWIVFGLDFALLYALPWTLGLPLLAAVTAGAAVGYAAGEPTASAPALLGPVLAAVVALAVIGAVRALQQEIHERERLTAELLDAQEQLTAHERDAAIVAERDRIGRELHDTVAQSVLSIRMLLDTAIGTAPGSQREQLLAEARDAARRTSLQARSVLDESADGVAGAELPERLRDALHAATAGTALRADLRCDVAPDTLSSLPRRLAGSAVRLVQNLVANVVQHADAQRVVVSLGSDGHHALLLDVVDDGVGLAPGTPEGFGLRAARARVRAIGGTLALESTIGSGTAVQIRLPLPETGPDREELP